MIVWEDGNYECKRNILVHSSIKKDFIEALECEMFSNIPENVWVVSHSAAHENDIDVIGRIISKVNNYSGSPQGVDFVENLICEMTTVNLQSIVVSLKYVKKKSHIETKLINSLYELFFTINYIFDNIILNGPIDDNANWLDDELSLKKNILEALKISAIKSCYITSSLSRNIDELRDCCTIFEKSKPHDNLTFLASYFLFSSQVNKNKKEYTKSALLLHRAIETLFISWLVSDREIYINPKGEVVGDKFIYLVDYMALVLKDRSLTDEEIGAVKDLNVLRNESKFAHGYKIVSYDNYTNMYEIIEKIILNDALAKEHLLRLYRIIQMPSNIYMLLQGYLESNNIIEKYDC